MQQCKFSTLRIFFAESFNNFYNISFNLYLIFENDIFSFLHKKRFIIIYLINTNLSYCYSHIYIAKDFTLDINLDPNVNF